MKALRVLVIEYVYDWQPGYVKCIFKDIHRKEWSIVDKVPTISSKNLNSESEYPIQEFIACEIINQSEKSVIIDLSKPWGISEVGGQTMFEVFANQIIDFVPTRI